MNRNRIPFWNLVEPEHAATQAFCHKLSGDREDGDDLYQDALVKALTAFDPGPARVARRRLEVGFHGLGPRMRCESWG